MWFGGVSDMDDKPAQITARKRATTAARKAANEGARLVKTKGPVVAKHVGTAAKRAGNAIKSPGWRQRTIEFLKRFAETITRIAVSVRDTVDKWAWWRTTSKHTADMSRRAYRAGMSHIEKKGYKDTVAARLKELPERYPGLHRSWKDFLHAFDLTPASTGTGRTKKTTARKKTARAQPKRAA